jgi:hypothetical protein
MKKTHLFIFLMLVASASFAQQPQQKKYLHYISSDSLKAQLTIIASDAMEGRETGTKGQRKAADYIESQFKSGGLSTANGLKNHQQIFYIKQDRINKQILTIDNQKINNAKDFYSQIDENTSGIFKSDKIIFVGYGIENNQYNDYKSLDVKGSVVAFFDGIPDIKEDENLDWDYWNLLRKINLAASKGAVGALVINPGSEKDMSWKISRNNLSDIYFTKNKRTTGALNYAIISQKTAKQIFGSAFAKSINKANKLKPLHSDGLTINKKIQLELDIKTDSASASNVIGVVEGSDKRDEFVYVTAHYDHLGIQDGEIYNGADDDGSGTCAVIQMAKAFAKAKQEGNGPRRTMIFMTVSGEEKGLWGSEYYTDHPLYPLDKTSADLNIDMIGRIDTERKKADTLNYVYVVGHNKISSELPVVVEGTNQQTTQLTLDYKFDEPNDPERIYYRSDHYNFARKGVPVLFFYDGMLLADYHQPTDDIELINWPLYEKRTQLIYHAAWELANRDNLLIRDKPLPKGRR